MPGVSIDELRMVEAVARTGSLTAAARALGVTQQAVSQKMRALERRWSLAMFERSARGTALTAHGALVAEWAGGLLSQVEAFDSAVRALGTSTAAHVRIGASLTVAEHLVPGWLVTYAQEPSAARVELTAVNSAAVIARVAAGTDDLGFIETPDIPRDLAHATVGTDEVVVVVSPRHPWAKRSRVTARELAATSLVEREEGSGTRLTVERAIAAVVGEGVLAEPAAELSTTAAIRATIMGGAGVGALSERAVRDDIAAGRLVRVVTEADPMSRPLTAIWRRQTRLPSGASRLLELAAGSGEKVLSNSQETRERPHPDAR
jgi:DNA-binding transcriptional LysR family regulator